MTGKQKINYRTTPVYIYRFVCNDPNIINTYVGSAINITQCKHKHKSVCNNPTSKHHNLLVYKIIRENGGWENWRMLEIDYIYVKDKIEAKQNEQYWIEYYNADLNMINAQKNENYNQEYRQKNKETLTEYIREYRQKNKESIAENKRQYHEKNKIFKKLI